MQKTVYLSEKLEERRENVKERSVKSKSMGRREVSGVGKTSL